MEDKLKIISFSNRGTEKEIDRKLEYESNWQRFMGMGGGGEEG